MRQEMTMTNGNYCEAGVHPTVHEEHTVTGGTHLSLSADNGWFTLPFYALNLRLRGRPCLPPTICARLDRLVNAYNFAAESL